MGLLDYVLSFLVAKTYPGTADGISLDEMIYRCHGDAQIEYRVTETGAHLGYQNSTIVQFIDNHAVRFKIDFLEIDASEDEVYAALAKHNLFYGDLNAAKKAFLPARDL